MSGFQSRTAELEKSNRYRDRIIVVLFAMLVLAIAGLVRAPHLIDVYQPPDLRYGSITRANQVPPTVVYAVAQYLFTGLNTWTEDGAEDYEANRLALRAYLTPRYHRFIKDDIKKRTEGSGGSSEKTLGFDELKGRTRTATPIPGVVYSDTSVKIIDDDQWIVYLDLHVEERMDQRPVKNIYVRYPVRVVRYRIARTSNPVQLALDGFAGVPERLQLDEAS